MKQLIYIIALLGLTGCLSSGGGDSSSAKLIDPVGSTPTTTIPVSTDISTADFSSKVITSSVGSITFSGSQFTDAECRSSYNITSATQVNASTVEIYGSIIVGSTTGYQGFLSNDPCIVATDPDQHYWSQSGSWTRWGYSYDVPMFIKYRIEKLPSGGFEVIKTIESRRLMYLAGPPPAYYFETVSHQARTYFQ